MPVEYSRAKRRNVKSQLASSPWRASGRTKARAERAGAGPGARGASGAGPGGGGRVLELLADLPDGVRDEAQAERHPDQRVGEPDARQRVEQRLQRRDEQEQPEDREPGDDARHGARQKHEVIEDAAEPARPAIR